jgi:phage regulator Rha-like protein
MSEKAVIPIERIAEKIYLIRDEKVMLDSDLAELYGVATKVLNQAVSRNKERFPEDFMFRLSDEEFQILKSQIVTSSWGGRRYPPHAFTEQGVAMLSSVLRSARAVQVNIAIVRAFVRLREMLATHKDLARKVDEHDRQIANLYAHVERLLRLPEPKKNPIGYVWPKEDEDDAG